MEAVELNLPPTEIAESDKKYQSSFGRCYEKLASFCENQLTPEWVDKNDQTPDKFPFY